MLECWVGWIVHNLLGVGDELIMCPMRRFGKILLNILFIGVEKYFHIRILLKNCRLKFG